MRTFTMVCACGALTAALLPAHAEPGLEVAFIEPQAYADAGSAPWEIDRTTRVLSTHLQRLSERYLAPDQSLRLEVLDVDLAGEVRQGPRHDVRIMLGMSDVPSITVRYTLVTPGQEARSGEDRIVDLDYLPMRRVPHFTEPLPYEQHMLEEWFKTRFAAQAR